MADIHHLRWRIGLAIASISLIQITSSITDADALLQFKNNLKNTEPLSTWISGTKPCDRGLALWYGLECSDDVVSGLRLDSLGLEGSINVNALSEVNGLGTLSLENNSFTGTLPSLKRMKGLKEIRISKNRFSGEIPGGYFVGMLSLKSVRFADNEFSGEIPWSLNTVTNLEELEVQNNMFVGRIPELPQKTLTMFNVSNNRLSGEIPDGLQRFDSDSFSGNADICGLNLKKPCKEGKLDTRRKAVDEMIEKAIMMGGAGLLSLVLLALIMIKTEERKTTYNFTDKSVTTRLKSNSISNTLDESNRNGFSGSGKRSDSVKISSDLVAVNEEKGVFGMSDLMKAGAESLGDGKDSGFGMSYKAVMVNGLIVVVKRMKDCNRVGKDGFEIEMRKLGRVKHPNLLPPLAYHYRRDEKLFITEFVPAGSLFYLLHGDPRIRKELTWAVRLIIIKGIARGLEYLHTMFPTSALPHGNLKSSNVLISSNCEPLLSEFGLDPIVNTTQATDLLFAYKAPEAANYNIISPKCDVFCLGIVILEILTGKFPFQYFADGAKGVDVVGWVEMCITQGRMLEVFDRDLMTNVTQNSRLEMEKLLYIGADCAERNPDLRLTLEEAVNRIDQIRYGGNQEYHQPHYSSESQPLSLSSSFNSYGSQSQSYENNFNSNLSGHVSQSGRNSIENLMMIHNMTAADVTGGNSGRRGGKQKVEGLDKCVNLSSRLKQDGYATTKQGMDQQQQQQKEKQMKALAHYTFHHNVFGLMDDTE